MMNLIHFVVFLISYSSLINCQAVDISTKCQDSTWVPYRDQKCYKILHYYGTQPIASEACRTLLPFEDMGIHLPSAILTVDSADEQEFINNWLFEEINIADSVWVGAIRDCESGQFSWLDGTVFGDHVFSNWAENNPADDDERNCIEFRSNYSRNVKVPTINSVIPGTWYNVPCTKRNLIICQNFQLVPIYNQLQKAQREMLAMKQEIDDLRNGMDDLRTELYDLKKRAVTNVGFQNVQNVDLFNNPGHYDVYGVVVTGVKNHNSDGFPDRLDVRKMQIFQDGRWVAL